MAINCETDKETTPLVARGSEPIRVVVMPANEKPGCGAQLVALVVMGIIGWAIINWLCAGAPGTGRGTSTATNDSTDPFDTAIEAFRVSHPELTKFRPLSITDGPRWAKGERRIVIAEQEIYMVYFEGHRIVSVCTTVDEKHCVEFVWREDWSKN